MASGVRPAGTELVARRGATFRAAPSLVQRLMAPAPDRETRLAGGLWCESTPWSSRRSRSGGYCQRSNLRSNLSKSHAPPRAGNRFRTRDQHRQDRTRPGCGPGGRGFESRRSPSTKPLRTRGFLLSGVVWTPGSFHRTSIMTAPRDAELTAVRRPPNCPRPTWEVRNAVRRSLIDPIQIASFEW